MGHSGERLELFFLAGFTDARTQYMLNSIEDTFNSNVSWIAELYETNDLVRIDKPCVNVSSLWIKSKPRNEDSLE